MEIEIIQKKAQSSPAFEEPVKKQFIFDDLKLMDQEAINKIILQEKDKTFFLKTCAMNDPQSNIVDILEDLKNLITQDVLEESLTKQDGYGNNILFVCANRVRGYPIDFDIIEVINKINEIAPNILDAILMHKNNSGFIFLNEYLCKTRWSIDYFIEIIMCIHKLSPKSIKNVLTSTFRVIMIKDGTWDGTWTRRNVFSQMLSQYTQENYKILPFLCIENQILNIEILKIILDNIDDLMENLDEKLIKLKLLMKRYTSLTLKKAQNLEAVQIQARLFNQKNFKYWSFFQEDLLKEKF